MNLLSLLFKKNLEKDDFTFKDNLSKLNDSSFSIKQYKVTHEKDENIKQSME